MCCSWCYHNSSRNVWNGLLRFDNDILVISILLEISGSWTWLQTLLHTAWFRSSECSRAEIETILSQWGRFIKTGPWITLDHFHSVAIISPTAAAGHTPSHNIAFIHPLRLGTISSRVGWKEGRGKGCFYFFCAPFYPGGCAENK